jgi:hypothetical protein
VDGDAERGLPRPLKAGLAGLGLAVLLGVVALAARSRHPGAGGVHLHQRGVPAWVANDLLTIVVIAYALGALVLAVAFFLLRDKWRPPIGRSWLRQLVMLAVVLVSLALLGYRFAHLRNAHHARAARSHEVASGRRTKAQTLPRVPSARRPAQFDWVFAAAVGGGLALLAILLLARRRGELTADERETIEEELSAVVSDTIDDLRREADARKAVIAAYARMERVLAQHGQPRHPSEAPFEYLSRILLRLRVRPAAVRELTELFERAKFSTHEIDHAMKERAIAALVSVRHDLQAPLAAERAPAPAPA